MQKNSTLFTAKNSTPLAISSNTYVKIYFAFLLLSPVAFNPPKYFTSGRGFKKIFISYGVRIKRLFNCRLLKNVLLFIVIIHFLCHMPDPGIFTFQNILTVSHD